MNTIALPLPVQDYKYIIIHESLQIHAQGDALSTGSSLVSSYISDSKQMNDSFDILLSNSHDRLCGLVVGVPGYRSGGPGSIPGTTRKKK
jgi:hypothetical protein